MRVISWLRWIRFAGMLSLWLAYWYEAAASGLAGDLGQLTESCARLSSQVLGTVLHHSLDL